MALRQQETARITPAKPQAFRRLLRQRRGSLIILGIVVLSAALAMAVMDGLRHNADLKASELLSRAKTQEDFCQILAQVPKSYLTFDILMNLGNVSHNEGKPEDARKYYQEAGRLYSKGFERAASLCALGMLSAEQRDYAKACETLQEALVADPRGVKAPEILFQWGRILGAASQTDAAKAKFNQLLQDFPGGTWAGEASRRLSGWSDKKD